MKNKKIRVYFNPDKDIFFDREADLTMAWRRACWEVGAFGVQPRTDLRTGPELFILNVYGDWGRVVITAPISFLPEARRLIDGDAGDADAGDADAVYKRVVKAIYPEGAWYVQVSPWGDPLEFDSKRKARRYARMHASEIIENWNY